MAVQVQFQVILNLWNKKEMTNRGREKGRKEEKKRITEFVKAVYREIQFQEAERSRGEARISD
jgi:hypothetical protein